MRAIFDSFTAQCTTPKDSVMLNVGRKPREAIEFVCDDQLGTFTKICCFPEHQWIDNWDICRKYCYIDSSCTSRHDPIREIITYKILESTIGNKSCELFPSFISWRVLETCSKCEMTLRKATLGTVSDYFRLNQSEEDILLHNSVAGTTRFKLSIGIRLLCGVYALNFVADIAHNDLDACNMLLDTTDFTFLRVKFIDSGGVRRSVVVPTFGVKPLICDFGMATRSSTTFNLIDDYDQVMVLLDGTLPNWKYKAPVRTSPGVVATAILRFHCLLMEEDPMCTATATSNNTCLLDLSLSCSENTLNGTTCIVS